MTIYQRTIEKIQSDNIEIDEMDFNKLKGLVICDDEKYHIGIKKDLSVVEKRCVLEHEYSHILCDALYTLNNNKNVIQKRENKANDNMIKRLNLVEQVIPYLKEQAPIGLICEELLITEAVLAHTLNYIKRKEIRI